MSRDPMSRDPMSRGLARGGAVGGRRHELVGTITSCGFASGDRVVIGHWRRSPIGPFTDLMWSEPDGLRVLVAPDDAVARFVTSVYRFDRLEVAPFETWSGPRSIIVRAGEREVHLVGGRGVRVPLVRPLWFTRWVEGPLARLLMGVRTHGTSPTGVEEWYRATAWRPLQRASASIEGVDLGEPRRVEPPVRVGFSEPPRRPSMVDVRPLLVDPSGRLDAVVEALERRTLGVGTGGAVGGGVRARLRAARPRAGRSGSSQPS